MPTIQIENVSKSFSGRVALHPTTLEINAGEFVTILGGSGSGKTTLLKLINRLHEPDSGIIRVGGEDVSRQPVNKLRLGMGYVIQNSGLFKHLSVAENIAVVPRLLNWRGSEIRQRVDEMLTLVGLEAGEYRDRYPLQLSGGQQQRVGLARALAGNPPLLLMDEPFGAVDPIVRQRLQDEMLALKARLGKTIVFVTHDVQEAFKLGDRVMMMQDGQVHQYDTPDIIMNRPADDFVESLVEAGGPQSLSMLETGRDHSKLSRLKPSLSSLGSGTSLKPCYS
jgi:osmoprotectant transport system ATP-binding protein